MGFTIPHKIPGAGCAKMPETFQHITAGYKMQAGTAYMELHYKVAGIVYRYNCARVWTGSP